MLQDLQVLVPETEIVPGAQKCRLHEYCGGGGGTGGSGHGAGAGRKGLLSQDNLTSMSL